MKKIQYQIVRYVHDAVTTEFVNVGVIVFHPEAQFLKGKFINKFGRVSQFFLDINGQYLIHSLKYFEKEIEAASSHLSELFSKKSSITEITSSILPKDDSALICSELYYAIDINPQSTLDDLYERLVNRYQNEIEKNHLDDKVVWKKVYKQHFDKYGITEKLKSHVVATSNDTFEFDKAWKNGVWNCYQTLSFDLKRAESIKNKVYKWSGILNELENSNEKIHMYFLTSDARDRKALNKFIDDTLSNPKGQNVQVTIVHEKQAEKFAQNLKKQIDVHDQSMGAE